MKKTLIRFLSVCLCLALFGSMVPAVAAYRIGEPYSPDLSEHITNPEKRRYVQMMIDYYLRTNSAIQRTLEEGYSAVFVFEGCSDNMDDPELSDLSYYRVSAVCVSVRLDAAGMPCVTYFNEDCSTLPDRPLEYGAWALEETGEVGPATVQDGTYELYSVRHAGSYEALQIRTAPDNETVAAVYMTPEGYVTHPATEINIHTRTGNHVIERAMWSAGCILVGDGDWSAFTDLVEATYYAVYEEFDLEQKVGTITINRQYLKEELYTLYGDRDAVDMLLANSRQEIPQMYLRQCTKGTTYEEKKLVRAVRSTELMSLPCSNSTDPRSIQVTQLSPKDKVEISGSIVNTAGNLWYEVVFGNKTCYAYSDDVEEVPKTWIKSVIDYIFG